MFPAHRVNTGNNIALANEPTAPAVFMAAESVPDHSFPTSQHTVQLEATVRSSPNVVNAKHAMNQPTECMNGAGNIERVANANPTIGSKTRDNLQFPLL